MIERIYVIERKDDVLERIRDQRVHEGRVNNIGYALTLNGCPVAKNNRFTELLWNAVTEKGIERIELKAVQSE
jgi:hypothetical protein